MEPILITMMLYFRFIRVSEPKIVSVGIEALSRD
jgi:hypothetical protein